jgi:hypothetical protein
MTDMEHALTAHALLRWRMGALGVSMLYAREIFLRHQMAVLLPVL